jgi:hypothetical protein
VDSNQVILAVDRVNPIHVVVAKMALLRIHGLQSGRHIPPEDRTCIGVIETAMASRLIGTRFAD